MQICRKIYRKEKLTKLFAIDCKIVKIIKNCIPENLPMSWQEKPLNVHKIAIFTSANILHFFGNDIATKISDPEHFC